MVGMEVSTRREKGEEEEGERGYFAISLKSARWSRPSSTAFSQVSIAFLYSPCSK